MGPVKIKDDVYWIGALDPDLRLFDVLFPTKQGTTYNSYLIKGEKIAVIDTVKAPFQEGFMANLRSLVDPAQIDYIITNHTELDHSGSLLRLLEKAKDAEVVISKTGEHFLKNTVNRDLTPLRVTDGDTIDLGGKSLHFVWAPFLHWPDTMFTYLVEEKILFPCDAFGSHFCDERLFDDLVGDFSFEFKQYFDGLVRPFKDKVLEAIQKIKGWQIEIIAPSHGPILRTDPTKYIESYARWSSVPKEEGKRALLFYASAYGNTKRMAQEIAEGISQEGVEIKLFDAVEIDPSDLLDEIEAAQAILAGSITINGDAVKPIWDLLSSLATLKVKGKVGAAFGSYGWSGEAVGLIEERLRKLKFKVPEPGVRATFVPTAEDLENCRQLGRRIARNL